MGAVGRDEHISAPADGWLGRTFPAAATMAEADESFYRGVVKAGYRGAYLIALSRAVADGVLDLESLAPSAARPLPDDEVERALLALPGVGPYAAAHVMMTLGRHSRLILDSWTRPTYARLIGRRSPPSDTAIRRRFARYREHAGLAFWLFLTRDWVEEPPPDLRGLTTPNARANGSRLPRKVEARVVLRTALRPDSGRSHVRMGDIEAGSSRRVRDPSESSRERDPPRSTI